MATTSCCTRAGSLWEFHKADHSAEVLSPLTDYRTHPLEILSTVLRRGWESAPFRRCSTTWPAMREDLVDNRRLRDERDDAHHAVVGRAREGIDLEDLLRNRQGVCRVASSSATRTGPRNGIVRSAPHAGSRCASAMRAAFAGERSVRSTLSSRANLLTAPAYSKDSLGPATTCAPLGPSHEFFASASRLRRPHVLRLTLRVQILNARTCTPDRSPAVRASRIPPTPSHTSTSPSA